MRNLLSILFLFLFTSLSAQHFNSVKIDLKDRSIVELAKLGLDVEHGIFAKGKHFTGVFSDKELMTIEQAGFQYEVLIEDLSNYRRMQHRHDHDHSGVSGARNPGPCEVEEMENLDVPENFDLGSFLGFFTYEEMIANLDAMAAQYPDLITIKAPIDTILTHEGRPIYWVKISDNPNADEVEPEILYTAVHHAREPGGLSSLIYFMWHTLENYESDPKIRAMVDETELYFIPCLNPDGYIFNVDNYFNGENFFWRKNRRDNGDGTFGVDLNRNYDYEFGFDDLGSSTDPDDATYRGPAGFSEPETQASKVFCEAHEFQIALNYHTFGNLLIYPWGYDAIGVADEVFLNLAQEMVAENGFFAGTGFETVGYPANGNSDDWMYGENVTKPAIYSMTPELGLGGFYPAESEIMGIIQSALPQNISTGLLAHPYPKIQEQNDLLLSTTNAQAFNFRLQNIGLAVGEMTVSLAAVSDNIDIPNSTKTFNLTSQETIEDFITFNPANDILVGEELIFALSVDQGSYVISDTITKIFGIQEVIFSDIANNADNWITSDWGTTSASFVSAPTSLTDSPIGFYPADATTFINLNAPISLVDVEQATLSFWARWNIEAGYDYTQVRISTDGGQSFEPQCGRYTKAGTEYQDEGAPLYDGNQFGWVKEEIDLSTYLGEEVLIQFIMVSDEGLELDGFYVDDIEITTLMDNNVSIISLDMTAIDVRTYPNPAKEELTLELSQPLSETTLKFYNTQGILQAEDQYENVSKMNITIKNWPSGMYFYELLNNANGTKTTGKIFIR